MSYLNTILGILGIFGFIAAYITHLRGSIKDLENLLAGAQSDKKQAEWNQQIEAGKAQIKETERDYETARDSFHDKYGTGDSKPGG